MTATFFVMHPLPSIAGAAGDWIDLVTPLAVVAATALALAAVRAPPQALALAVVSGVLYVHWHGIHLAANSIGNEEVRGRAADVTHFWDEVFGHIEWHLGWIGLLAAVALGDSLPRGPDGDTRRWQFVVAAVLLGLTLFTSSVEGGTWWLVLTTTAVFVIWAVRRPRPIVVTCAAAFSIASTLIAVWAIWHRGMPQFSEVGWL
jgi:hypothetical protein